MPSKPPKKSEFGEIGRTSSFLEQLSPEQLLTNLAKLIEQQVYLSTMIWGPPGVGKSSIVAAVANNAGLGLVDLRLSQLAPT